MSLAVAVTGPTGEIGKPLMSELERRPEVESVLGMARRPFDPADEGWEKVTYRRGDILDRGSLAALFDGADVAVHLAFAIFGSREETRKVNLQGTRNVFEAAIRAGVKRLVYASSVAAYGFHPENPQPLTEDVPARGSEGFYYSAQKAELEDLLDELLLGSGVPGSGRTGATRGSFSAPRRSGGTGSTTRTASTVCSISIVARGPATMQGRKT